MQNLSVKIHAYKALLLILPFLTGHFIGQAQNTNYTPLYTSANFTKTIDVNFR